MKPSSKRGAAGTTAVCGPASKSPAVGTTAPSPTSKRTARPWIVPSMISGRSSAWVRNSRRRGAKPLTWMTRSVNLAGQLFRAAFEQQLAFVEEIDPLAVFGFVEIGGGPQDPDAFAGQLFDHRPQLAAGDRIDAHSRLVEQHQFRRAHQRAGQPQLLLHPAGEIARQSRFWKRARSVNSSSRAKVSSRSSFGKARSSA